MKFSQSDARIKSALYEIRIVSYLADPGGRTRRHPSYGRKTLNILNSLFARFARDSFEKNF